MKPTDEERREVAQNLRRLAEKHKGVPFFLIEKYLGLVSDEGFIAGSVFTSECVLYLADLIEPGERTCCDEERREVAKRLRGIEAVQFDEGELVDCGEVEAELGLVSDDGAWYRLEDVLRLADLIEPAPERMCRFEERYYDDGSSPWPYYVCSECGERLHYRDIVTEYGEESYEMLPYCAGCGAKVTEEES